MVGNGQPAPKRRKVSLACIQCRERKIRCSGEKPVCASCSRRPGDLSAECSYAIQSDTESNVNESIQTLFERLRRLESRSNLPPSEQELVQSGPSSYSETSTLEGKRSRGNVAIHDGDSSSGKAVSANTNDSQTSRLKQNEVLDTTRSPNYSEERNRSNRTSDRAYNSPDVLQSAPNNLTGNALDNEDEETETNNWEKRVHLESSESDANTVTDAMGTSSIYDEASPEESAQYYGGSSGIAFMRAISKVLAGNPGEDRMRTSGSSVVGVLNSSTRKHDEKRDPLSQLPKFEGTKLFSDYFALPPRSVADYLLNNYWTRAYPLYPLLHRPTFEAAYATLWKSSSNDELLAKESDAGLGNGVDAGPSTQCFYCAFNMMLALGSQFAEVPAPRRKDLATMFETRSKNLLVVDMMDKGSLAVVQTLLLTGQYLQSTFYPQRCWNSIGVACRIAQALGLHVEGVLRKTGVLELEMRRRVWSGCILLDMFGSMTMGRPLMISHQYSTALPSSIGDDELIQTSSTMISKTPSTVEFFREAVKLAQTLGIILTTIYDQSISQTNEGTSSIGVAKLDFGPAPTNLKTVLELDKRLVRFQNELPIHLQSNQDGERLRRSIGDTVKYVHMQTNVLHAWFLQTRILLYRDSFIKMCQDSVSKMDGQQDEQHHNPEFDLDTFYMTRCAASCVASAKELLDLVHRTSGTKNTDAWWYNVYFTHTSGMVVKLAQLCSPLRQIVSPESLSESWNLCRETLLRMTSYSPVAKRCIDSLEEIEEKISLWESKKARAKEKPAHQDNSQPTASQIPRSNSNIPNSAKAGSTQDSDKANETNSHNFGYAVNMEPFTEPTLPFSETYIPADIPDDEALWSTDLRYWWNFPGIDFDLENFT